MPKKATKSKKKADQLPDKVPPFLETLLVGDFVLGLSFVAFSAFIIVQFIQGLTSPPEERQWTILFAPALVSAIIMIVVLSLYLINAPYRVTHSSGIHQLKQRLYGLLIVNGLTVFWTLYNNPYRYAYIAEIVTGVLIVLNVVSIFWTRSLGKR